MFSVLLVACSVAWTSGRGTHTNRGGRKLRGRGKGASIVQNIHTLGEDGSYSYGWKASDGSFKKETRLPSGEVTGEFGYRDSQGNIVTTKYGVNIDTQFGFKGQL